MTGAELECDHHESLYGRCAACGMTWDEQARRMPPAVAAANKAEGEAVRAKRAAIAARRDAPKRMIR